MVRKHSSLTLRVRPYFTFAVRDLAIRKNSPYYRISLWIGWFKRAAVLLENAHGRIADSAFCIPIKHLVGVENTSKGGVRFLDSPEFGMSSASHVIFEIHCLETAANGSFCIRT